MKSISGFFDKFKNKAVLDVKRYLVVIETIKKYTNIELDIKDVSISKGVITLKTSSSMKNEIFIKKQIILNEISKKINHKKIFDIK